MERVRVSAAAALLTYASNISMSVRMARSSTFDSASLCLLPTTTQNNIPNDDCCRSSPSNRIGFGRRPPAPNQNLSTDLLAACSTSWKAAYAGALGASLNASTQHASMGIGDVANFGDQSMRFKRICLDRSWRSGLPALGAGRGTFSQRQTRHASALLPICGSSPERRLAYRSPRNVLRRVRRLHPVHYQWLDVPTLDTQKLPVGMSAWGLAVEGMVSSARCTRLIASASCRHHCSATSGYA